MKIDTKFRGSTISTGRCTPKNFILTFIGGSGATGTAGTVRHGRFGPGTDGVHTRWLQSHGRVPIAESDLK